ncbi:MAG: hypothetical protein AAGI49_04275 [Bacteroidota bacterium]
MTKIQTERSVLPSSILNLVCYLASSFLLFSCSPDETPIQQAVPSNAAFVYELDESHPLLAAWDFPSDQFILGVPQTNTPDAWSPLFLTKSPANFEQQFDEKFKGKVRVARFEGVTIYESQSLQMSFAQHQGILMLAPHAIQIESAIQQLKNRQAKTPVLSNTTELYLAFRASSLPNFLRKFSTPKFRAQLQFLEASNTWSSGYLERSDSSTTITMNLAGDLPILFKTPKSDDEILAVLPDHITAYLWANLPAIYSNFQTRLSQAIDPSIKQEYFGQTFALAISQNNEKILILELNQKGQQALAQLKNEANWTANQHLLYEFYTNNQQDFFTFDERYLYLFESAAELQNWVNKYSTDQVLKNDIPFLQKRQAFPSKQYGFAYGRLKQLINFLPNILNADALPAVQTLLSDELLAQDVWMSFQADAKLHLQLRPAISQNLDRQISTTAPVDLYEEAATAPQIISWQDQHYLFLQDAAHRLYCFDESLNLRWTKELEGLILSDINRLNNGNILFNTAYRVHAYDLAGNPQTAFPFELQTMTDIGICLIDFTGLGEYAYLVAGQNNAVYAYDLTGNTLAGWNPKDSLGSTIHNLQHFQNDSRDFILIAADSSVYAFDRLGKKRFVYTDPTLITQQMEFQSDSDYPRIVVPSQTGHFHIISLAGESFRLKASSMRPTRFCFADIWGDERKDYWYLTGQQLTIFAYEQTDFAARLQINFEAPVAQVFPITYKGEKYIATTFPDSKRIALYDAAGNLHPSFPVAGDGQFIIFEQTLYVSEGKALYRYFLN